MTIKQLWERFYAHAREYYRFSYSRKDRSRRLTEKPSHEAQNFKCAFRFVLDKYADLPAEEFGPKKFKEIRELMIARDICRQVINRYCGRIRRVFRWAMNDELLPVGVYFGLSAMFPLKQGRTTARESLVRPKKRPRASTVLLLGHEFNLVN